MHRCIADSFVTPLVYQHKNFVRFSLNYQFLTIFPFDVRHLSEYRRHSTETYLLNMSAVFLTKQDFFLAVEKCRLHHAAPV